jgi:polysaccharide pyruvyl transferase WcaK-like protein
MMECTLLYWLTSFTKGFAADGSGQLKRCTELRDGTGRYFQRMEPAAEMNDEKRTIALYMHAGSGNHGCEAIADSLIRLLAGEDLCLVTNSAAEDAAYLPEDVQAKVRIEEERHIGDHFAAHAAYYAYRTITGDRESFLRYRFAPLLRGRRPDLAVSIGGDNYCYPSMVDDLELANAMLCRRGIRTALFGCSIEPDLLTGEAKDPAARRSLLEDMNRYSAIVARESITYRALLDAGLPEEKVFLRPDPAFMLPTDRSAVPETFHNAPEGVVGLNISPMAEDYADDKNAPVRCAAALIRHILDETGMSVALIPHVVWKRSDDRGPLGELYAQFRDNPRVILVEDHCAELQKGIIGACRFFVGARTHATIAAYSSLVPTLVIGYSVKAKGIAEDLFGGADNYVLPVQTMRDPRQLIDGFDWLCAHEGQIRECLSVTIPETKKAAADAGRILRAAADGQLF